MTPEQLIFQFAQPTRYAADDFLTADCNREARKWVSEPALWPGHALILHGPARCGKTHLANIWAAERNAVIADAADLTADRVPDLAETDIVIEAVDRLQDQRALFHLWNLTREQGRRLLMTARTPPAGWPFNLPDLTSRIGATAAVAVGEPDADLLPALLVKLSADRQLSVPPDVVLFFAPRLDRSFASVEAVVAKLDHAAVQHGRRVTLPLAREVMNGLTGTGSE